MLTYRLQEIVDVACHRLQSRRQDELEINVRTAISRSQTMKSASCVSDLRTTDMPVKVTQCLRDDDCSRSVTFVTWRLQTFGFDTLRVANIRPFERLDSLRTK